MSYILDALNKSEQDRKNQGSPRLDTVHRHPPDKPGGMRTWVIPLVMLAALNAGFIAFWMTREAPSTSMLPDMTLPDTTGSTGVASNGGPSSSAVATVNNQARAAEVTEEGTGSVGSEQELLITPEDFYRSGNNLASTEPARGARRIGELPSSIQRQIPDLKFSSHIFADEASFRMVNINGRLLREGDMLDDKTRLVEITEQGVVLGHEQYTFEVSVLRDWSFN